MSKRVSRDTICTIPNCGKNHKAKGLCNRHYELQRVGDKRNMHSPLFGKDVTIRNIDGTENYLVSSDGNIFRKTRIINKGGVDRYVRGAWARINSNSPYRQVPIDNVSFLVHRLVAEAFVPNPGNLPQVNHIDGNKHNNDYTNLEWVTPKGNADHAYQTGLNRRRYGTERGRVAKLTEGDVVIIRKMFGEGKRIGEIQSIFNKVGKGSIGSIVRGQGWKHV